MGHSPFTVMHIRDFDKIGMFLKLVVSTHKLVVFLLDYSSPHNAATCIAACDPRVTTMGTNKQITTVLSLSAETLHNIL